ncbi:hypothetical protein BST81_08220 [Leptolyngbya sp. 'hensonii']|uniref:hypothetical protein n=1 Tax=Leptolyngbya sp. 'hensonii' TaxID=1922337 RepID=UPI00094FA79F|nr:hypothetical protein [Leptolyngbya sp. 'hensonii']OLP18891.1 hypothetical protein BST81_08220 [Leptolyngbya sp. 'hensonii']
MYTRTQSKLRKTAPPSHLRVLPSPEVISQRATDLAPLIKAILDFKLGQSEYPEALLEQYPQIKNLNSFSKQVTTQMLRSNSRYQGYKVETKNYLLKPSTLFLLGTLCGSFDYMNTSPLYGSTILDIGCGALSPYWEENKQDDLMVQFLNDRPPIRAEVLQLLGGRITGIETRPNAKPEYDYQVSYKHRVMPLGELGSWASNLSDRFDLITCLGVLDRYEFSLCYPSPRELTRLFMGLRKILSPQGLLYADIPLIPASPAHRQTNQQIFQQAGLRIIHAGCCYVLEATP